MNDMHQPAPVEIPKKVDFFEGLSTSLKINYLIAIASNLTPVLKNDSKNFKYISIQELRCLSVIVRLGPQTLSQLAKASRQNTANVSRTTTKLLHKKLLVKISNPEHKRSYFLWVTNSGLDLYNTFRPEIESRAEQYTLNFTEKDKEQLCLLLQRYIENAT
ncbi:MarR family winged helix-turn-helix transcriptional regulator [Parahaliea mediterranea]|uniref:Winged helix-turn-helix transcriptional regulator n=1 Tax=Parahaliea mediterranea TaxID=651086 RepID=A0A939IKJ4_9GAMM|nr:MarR family winged helix-turn-helix transcriptional regulator [Parahaliea mediterranea]MBN7797386.1 winged helix-turn-helix transcriptional regulator [Parahaliea mediterranea]